MAPLMGRLSAWYAALDDEGAGAMVLGVGVDMVTISEIARYWPEGAEGLVDSELDPFIKRTFTAAELAQARGRHNAPEYLAGRFAVKEAVFKALAPCTDAGFDLRIVECLDDEAGAPHVTLAGPIAAVLAEAGANEVLVSISNEGDTAVAFAVAQ